MDGQRAPVDVGAQVSKTYAFTANNSGTGATESLTTS
jgi:hypothetical protein